MIKERRNPDGSLTIGIIEEEPKPVKVQAEPKEPKEAKPKAKTTKKSK